METEPFPILLFDGVCHLCQRSVQFVLKRDRTESIRFASLQSDVGQQLIEKYHIPNTIDSLIFIEQASYTVGSEAVLRLVRYFGWPWTFFLIGKGVPIRFREGLYRWVAQNRYKWFGKDQACPVPSPRIKDRFLD